MNRPQRMMIRIIGFTLFFFALTFSIMISTPFSQDIRVSDNICNAQLNIMGYDVEIGQLAQDVLRYEEECRKIHILRLGVDYSWILLTVGAVLFFIGVWAGLGAKGKKEIFG